MTFRDLKISLEMLSNEQLNKPVIIFDHNDDASFEISWVLHSMMESPELEIIYEREVDYE